jgi:hypothetical protein
MMAQFGCRLRSKAERRAMPSVLRDDLRAAGDGIRSALRSLRSSLVCPDAARP